MYLSDGKDQGNFTRRFFQSHEAAQLSGRALGNEIFEFVIFVRRAQGKTWFFVVSFDVHRLLTIYNEHIGKGGIHCIFQLRVQSLLQI